MRWFLVSLMLLSLFLPTYANEANPDLKLFKEAVRQYEIGSYSTALDMFLKLLRPDSKYYKDALLMLAKTYYAIGRKTGKKKYFWQALNYLQLYFIELRTLETPWEYYYVKAKIYEALGFYEQALAVYRVAFLRARTNEEKVKTTIGIIRTSVWIRRPDIAEEYFILISTQNLSKEDLKEITFIKGLMLFSEGKYEEAMPYFFNLYRRYEEYLIDNPAYYLLVAEDVYRVGKLKLAEQLFRRIISLTKDKVVIRKSFIRLGDIELRRKNYKLAFVYYYTVIRDYPSSDEAIVARLKIIPLLDMPDILYRAYLTKDNAFKDPIKYIAQILVNYRTTYVGIYALADLGYLVFKLGLPDKPFERLVWEVSLVFPEEIKYEQREFLRYLWEPFLTKLPFDKGCELYRANPRFFQELFDKSVLLKFAFYLKKCNMRELRLRLLDYMLERWKDDESKLLMVNALVDTRDFFDALKILRTVHSKDCNYWKLLGEINVFYKTTDFNFLDFKKACDLKRNDVDIVALNVFYLSDSSIEEAYIIFKTYKEDLLRSYSRNSFVKAAVQKLLERAAYNNRYDIVLDISDSLYKHGYKNCLVSSYLLIALVRMDKIDTARNVYEEISGCVDSFSSVAKIVYDNAITEREIKDEALSTVGTNRKRD